MKFKKIILTIFVILFSYVGYSQFGITSYSIYALGINTNQNRMISGEFKTFTNRTFENIAMELDAFYNFKACEYHRFSAGIGLNAFPFAGADQIHSLTFPLELEVFPLKDFKKLSFLFELTPEYVVEEDFNLRYLWGIRYTFGKKKNKD